MRTPTGTAILHVLSEFLGVFAFYIDDKPEYDRERDADQKIGGVKAGSKRLKRLPEAFKNV